MTQSINWEDRGQPGWWILRNDTDESIARTGRSNADELSMVMLKTDCVRDGLQRLAGAKASQTFSKVIELWR